DPINHLYSLYVKVNSIPELEDESRLYFKKLEDGDEECIKLWERFKELSLKNFSEIYDLLNIKFDILSGESLYNNKMDKTVKLLEKKGLLQEDDNAQIIDLEEYNLGKCLIKKSDGATLYMTRDLTAAIDRYEKYGFSRMFYEVGSEQKLHFKQLFKILELMGYEWAKDCVHIDHGLYLDSDGKKFATRKGKTVFMIDVLRETVSIANKIIEEKNPNLENRESIAKKIGVAAIILGDLKNNRITDMIFDIDKFLDFEGNTGPYLQYTYARASSIIKKGKTIRYKKALISNNIEYQLINLLSKMPYITEDSYSKLSPHIISTYCIELARLFNEFYHQCPVLNEPNKDIQSFRLALVQSTRQVIKNSLSILGIECPESM
ncbi:MAG: arginine--tRNA ligase, partial [Nanoarchaeota archaeon]